MSWKVVAQLVTADGSNVKQVFDITDFWHPVKYRSWVVPAIEVRSVQAAEIPLRLDHGLAPAGRITHLERRNGSVWCAGIITEPIEPDPGKDYFLSVEANYAPDGAIGRDIEIRGAALCERSCMTGLPPMVLARNGLDHHGQAVWRLTDFQQHMLDQADRYKPYGPIEVVDEREAAPSWSAEKIPRSEMGVIETRSAQLADVTGRTVEIVAAPYGVEASVPYQGRTITESFSNVAFANVNEQTNRDRIRVWLNHDAKDAVGRVTGLEPFDARGLVAEFKISRTRLGDETLELARDNVLDASVGFKVLDERWTGRSRRRVTKAWLHHLGLTSDPAYPGTHVVGMRGRPLTVRGAS